MITTLHHPALDTVLYDGQCRFCRSQVAILRGLDLFGGIAFMGIVQAIINWRG